MYGEGLSSYGPIGTLKDVGGFIGCKVCDKLGGYNTFKDLRMDWEVRDR